MATAENRPFDDQNKVKTITDESTKPSLFNVKNSDYRDHVNSLFLRHRGPFMKALQSCLLSD